MTEPVSKNNKVESNTGEHPESTSGLHIHVHIQVHTCVNIYKNDGKEIEYDLPSLVVVLIFAFVNILTLLGKVTETMNSLGLRAYLTEEPILCLAQS